MAGASAPKPKSSEDLEVGEDSAASSNKESIRAFFGQEVALPPKAYLPILLSLSFASACIDVYSIPTLGVFVANNTGNLILLALAAAQLRPSYPELVFPISCAVSLASSWLGSSYGGMLTRHFGSRTRGYLFGEFLLQALIAYLCAGLYYGHKLHYQDERTEYVAVALLSFSMGSQAVVVKAMKSSPFIPTQVATGAMADFFSDPKIFEPLGKNKGRDERFYFIISFFAGGVIGGLAFRYSQPETSLILTASGKLLSAVGFLFLAPAMQKAPHP